MKVWITKYALTMGIFEKDVELCLQVAKGTMVREVDVRWISTYHKPDWHESKEAAIAHAEDMRKKKITAMKKQIAKLEALKF